MRFIGLVWCANLKQNLGIKCMCCLPKTEENPQNTNQSPFGKEEFYLAKIEFTEWKWSEELLQRIGIGIYWWRWKNKIIKQKPEKPNSLTRKRILETKRKIECHEKLETRIETEKPNSEWSGKEKSTKEEKEKNEQKIIPACWLVEKDKMNCDWLKTKTRMSR